MQLDVRDHTTVVRMVVDSCLPEVAAGLHSELATFVCGH